MKLLLFRRNLKLTRMIIVLKVSLLIYGLLEINRICVTLHYIDGTFNLNNDLIGFEHFGETHCIME